MGLVDTLRIDYCDCQSRRCSGDGCRIKLGLLWHNHVLISGTKYQQSRGFTLELCDFILFDSDSMNNVRIAAIELKGGYLDEDEVRKGHSQLQNGALVADQMAQQNEIDTFSPFLVKRKGINSMAVRLLLSDKYRVIFRGEPEFIKLVKSGSSLQLPGS